MVAGNGPTLEEASERDPLVFAALVFLRRELAKVAEIRLTPLDFDAWQTSTTDGVRLNYDEASGDIILMHESERSDA